MGAKKFFKAGEVYVETGMLYVGDPGSLLTGEVEAGQRYQDLIGRLDERHEAQGEDGRPAGKAHEPFGKGLGIVVPSGVGDGIYPVFVNIEPDGRVTSISVSFEMP